MVLVQRLLYQKIQKQQMDWLQTGWPIICSGLIQVFLLLFIFKGCKSLCVKHGELFWYSQGQNSLIKSTKVRKDPSGCLATDNIYCKNPQQQQHLLQESLATGNNYCNSRITNFFTFLQTLSSFQSTNIQLQEICYDNWKCRLNVLKDQAFTEILLMFKLP